MSDMWYCQSEGKLVGPMLLSEVQRLVDGKKAARGDQVRIAGDSWQIAGAVKGLRFAGGQAAESLPVVHGRVEVREVPAVSASKPAAPGIRRHLHLLLILALIPLIFYTYRPHEEFGDKLLKALRNHPELVDRVKPITDVHGNPTVGKDAFLAVFPEHKLTGAVLPFDTWTHWQIAGAAAAGFVIMLLLLFPASAKNFPRLMCVGIFTGTIGIFLLLGFQWVTFHGHLYVGGPVGFIVMAVTKFIAYSYTAAEDPNSGFLFSFAGYTLGIGLCEEFIKMLPLLWLIPRTSEDRPASWQKLLTLGLASGIGFGIAEGVIYAGRYYNGVQGPEIYYVRFISCAALHAVWSGANAIMLYKYQQSMQHRGRANYCMMVVGIMFVPMVLHGLYDTFLKLAVRDVDQNYHLMAIMAALTSFAWLALKIEGMHRRAAGLRVEETGEVEVATG